MLMEAGTVGYTFREIRVGELEKAVGFAGEHGCAVEAKQVRHPLSLDVRADEKTVAVALCVEETPGQYTVRLAMDDGLDDADLPRLAADTILRKMQAVGIGTARVGAVENETTDRLWSQTNWLDRIVDDAGAGDEDNGDDHRQRDSSPCADADVDADSIQTA